MKLTFTLDEINVVARKILSTYPSVRCFAFYADMGSGKTTLIRALCSELGVRDNVSSPTFSIINEYEIDRTKQKIYHMDWYRLKNLQDAVEAGVQDILENEANYCFIEWPQIASELIDKRVLRISIQSTSPTTRDLLIE
jgi:tRNA threonylcarbamoyladenosine biosynthesis protein TsaE